MTTQNDSDLITAAFTIAGRGAKLYLSTHHLHANELALFACLKSWVKAKLPEALHDSEQALRLGMGAIAEKTFAASMIQAGIEAAKECGMKTVETELTSVG